jgi:hypothetical protein
MGAISASESNTSIALPLRRGIIGPRDLRRFDISFRIVMPEIQ